MIFLINLIPTAVTIVLPIFNSDKFSSLAFAQTSNGSSILVPSNMNRLDFTLKSDKPANSDSFVNSAWFVGVISGSSAIAGGFLGSYMTNRSNRKMEDDRHKRQIEREKIQQEQQDKEKKLFKQQVMASVYSELNNFSFWLRDLATYTDSADDINSVKSLFETLSEEYPGMPYDVRLTLFSPEILLGPSN